MASWISTGTVFIGMVVVMGAVMVVGSRELASLWLVTFGGDHEDSLGLAPRVAVDASMVCR